MSVPGEPTTVLCAVRGAREADVVTALHEPGSGFQVTRRCADLPELLAAAAAGAGRVAVVSADLPAVDREAVAHLHVHGVRVVALIEDSSWQGDRMRALGVDVVVDLAAPVDDLRAGVRAAAGPESAGAHADPARPAPPATEDLTPGGAASRHGRVVAVWGPTGAPGRTTLAVNLAAELAGTGPGRRRRGRGGGRGSVRRRDRRTPEVQVPAVVPGAPAADVLLVDADTYAGSVAQHLGMLDESPGLAAAARSAGQGALDRTALAVLAAVVAPRLRVLTGISRASRWPELPGSSLDVVWDVARGLADWTIVDCGFAIEQDELLSYDTRAPQRNGATLSALATADVVVVVGGADPVGLHRLVRALDDLAEAGVAAGALRTVVANRVRSSVVGARPEQAVREAMARYAGVEELHVVPDDRALDVALREGRALAEAAPAAPARRAIAGIAAHVRTAAPTPDAVDGTEEAELPRSVGL